MATLLSGVALYLTLNPIVLTLNPFGKEYPDSFSKKKVLPTFLFPITPITIVGLFSFLK